MDDYIRTRFTYEYYKEYDCLLKCINPRTGYVLPYDGELVIGDKHIIIEVHGKQHYEICLLTMLDAVNKGITSEQVLDYQQWKDEYKKQYAISQGYYYLAIPYWTEQDESYKTLIDEKIKSILTTQN